MVRAWERFCRIWVMASPENTHAHLFYGKAGPPHRPARPPGEGASRLQRRGSDLARRLEGLCGIPTYYYLYRVGGLSAAGEKARPCPSCGGEWALAAPLHEIFDFKCDPCRLVSTLSWDSKD